jgi:hypothetical protein
MKRLLDKHFLVYNWAMDEHYCMVMVRLTQIGADGDKLRHRVRNYYNRELWLFYDTHKFNLNIQAYQMEVWVENNRFVIT